MDVFTLYHGGTWDAFAVPKGVTLRSLRQDNVNDRILHTVTNRYSNKLAIERLNREIGEKIGNILKVGPSGIFHLQESAIPECNTIDEVPIPIESAESSIVSSGTQTTPTLEGNVETGKEKEREGYLTTEEMPDGRETREGATRQVQSYSYHSKSWDPELIPQGLDPESLLKDDLLSPAAVPKAPVLSGSAALYREFLTKRAVRRGPPLPPPPPHTTAQSSLTTLTSRDTFTPGTSVVSDTDSNTTTTPNIYDSYEPPLDPLGGRVKAEIKLAMTALLNCLAEHVEGMPL